MVFIIRFGGVVFIISIYVWTVIRQLEKRLEVETCKLSVPISSTSYHMSPLSSASANKHPTSILALLLPNFLQPSSQSIPRWIGEANPKQQRLWLALCFKCSSSSFPQMIYLRLLTFYPPQPRQPVFYYLLNISQDTMKTNLVYFY